MEAKNQDSNTALGEIIILSPSQKREQERLQKEKAKKDVAEKARLAKEEKEKLQAVRRKKIIIIFCSLSILIPLAVLFYIFWINGVYGGEEINLSPFLRILGFISPALLVFGLFVLIANY